MKTKALIVNLIALTAIFSTNSAFANTKRGLAFNFKAPVSGVPSYTIGGAVRGDYCAVDRNNSQNMLAYVADKAMTTQSHPSVVVQLPELNSDKTAYLVIKDATEDYYQEQILTVPAKGGRVEIALDKSKPGLEVGSNYKFFLRLQCDRVARIEDPIIWGSISRVEDKLKFSPKATLEERFMAYARKGLWYDALALAVRLDELGDSKFFESLVSSLK